MKCYDCGKQTKYFRCKKCLEKAKKGKLKYEDTTKWSRINHFGSKRNKK